MRLRHGERGTAIVEFALVAPILFLLVLGILDFGRALNYYNHLTQLAGQGARAAAVDRNPDGSAIGTANADCPANTMTIQCQLAKTYTSSGELRDGISVCIPNSASAGDPVTVTATYDFNFIPFIGTALGSASITLSASQSERQEAAPSYGTGCVP